tara:strand:- start:630 stop:944 length:315 start_codon:yes stop_codon:yes gene_type:complete
LIGNVALVGLSMSHNIKDGIIYKGSQPAGSPIGSTKGGKIFKGGGFGGTPLGSTKGGKIFKGGGFGGLPLSINSNTIHNTIKNSKTYDLALMITAYHFLIKPIF